MRLKGKVAIVTGGGSGIGRATARLFAEEGARVVVADYNAQTGEETLRLIKQSGGEGLFSQTDVSQWDQVQKMVQVAVDNYSRIDILLNNAGVLTFGTVTETDEATWDRVMAINLKGVFLCSKAVLPHMIAAGGGSIINTSSSTGCHDACANAAAYVASKGGVALLTKCMAIDYARYNVRVNAICPGPTETPMLHEHLSAEKLAAFAATFPMKRLGQPAEIAQAVLFLASDEASFVTGAMLAVDGGQTAEV